LFQKGWHDIYYIYIEEKFKRGENMQINDTFAELLRFNAGYLSKSLENIPDASYFIKPGNRGNPLIWLLGHLVVNRGEILEILGGNPAMGNLADLFARGTKPDSDSSVYPKPQQLLAHFMKLASVTDNILKNSDPNLLNQKSWGQFESLGQNLAYSYMHETHHIGQVIYVLSLPGIRPDKKSSTRFRRPVDKGSTAKILLDNIKSVFA
jgi:uncharacterized damage-inducible protein DinB